MPILTTDASGREFAAAAWGTQFLAALDGTPPPAPAPEAEPEAEAG